MKIFNNGTGAIFRYKIGYRRNGKDYFSKNWVANLILDSGLNKVGSTSWPNCFSVCLFGDQVSPTPTSRNSGSVTFTNAVNVLTASGNFFVPADAGRLIKFNGVGGEYYISSYVSATVVNLVLTPSPAIVAETATVWYVNQTQLENLYSTTNTYSSAGGGANGTTDVVNVRTMQRTFVGSPVSGAPVTLTEIGFNDSASNSNLFDRDIITGGLGLIIGDQPLAVAQLVLTMNPAVSTPYANSATGYNNAGDGNLGECFSGFSFVAAGGNTIGPGEFDPNQPMGNFAAALATFTVPPFGSTGSLPANDTPSTINLLSYVSGTFQRDTFVEFDLTRSNGTIYGFIDIRGGGSGITWGILLTTPFVKTGSQVLSCIYRKTWQRILQN